MHPTDPSAHIPRLAPSLAAPSLGGLPRRAPPEARARARLRTVAIAQPPNARDTPPQAQARRRWAVPAAAAARPTPSSVPAPGRGSAPGKGHAPGRDSAGPGAATGAAGARTAGSAAVAARELARIERLPLRERLALRPAYEDAVARLEAATARRTVDFDRLAGCAPLAFRFVYSDVHWPYFLPVDERMGFDLRSRRLHVQTRLGPLRVTMGAACAWRPRTRILACEFEAPAPLRGLRPMDELVSRLLDEEYRFTYHHDGLACMRAKSGHLTVMRRVAPES